MTNNRSFRILFEDTHLIVLSKPAGLLSQGDHSGENNLVDELRVYLGRPYVGLVHRLDRNTSGIMIVGKRSKSAQRLTESLQKGDLKRTYLAWVLGRLEGKSHHWVHFLSKDEKRNQAEAVREVSPTVKGNYKRSELFAYPQKTLKWNGLELSLVRFELETGRSHQIRVQSSFEGYPLLGDTKYGSPERLFSRVALHSFSLEFPHPMSGEILKFEDSLPEDLDLLK